MWGAARWRSVVAWVRVVWVRGREVGRGLDAVGCRAWMRAFAVGLLKRLVGRRRVGRGRNSWRWIESSRIGSILQMGIIGKMSLWNFDRDPGPSRAYRCVTKGRIRTRSRIRRRVVERIMRTGRDVVWRGRRAGSRALRVGAARWWPCEVMRVNTGTARMIGRTCVAVAVDCAW